MLTTSLEALAMAGVDWVKYPIDSEEMEDDTTNLPPAHLLADDREDTGDEEDDEKLERICRVQLLIARLLDMYCSQQAQKRKCKS
ncbi:OLC1v1009298C1 [Oldenlandia corymbosa var. corymbosa]|uniref:OLC1v1009298C1 n=1 Tax=Oldenlandia corymbosa var. corymbosa TaxID=529605 RepID=A0AAV1DNP9_OLDCO|nr:OLC1v1009298C1 [Oldenlandia corymbosa var. corymbosa]